MILRKKNFYSVGADIARQEADIQNVTRTLSQSKTDLERAKESYAKAIEKESTFDNLTPKEKELKLNISILKALEALDKKAELNLQISPLENSIKEKSMELDSQLSKLAEVKESYAAITSEFETARSSASSINSDIAMHEADLRNISKTETQSKIDLDIAKESYAKALEEEANIENFKPKRKSH